MLKVIDRYLLRYFIMALITVTVGIGILIVIINMIEELRHFIDHHVSLLDILTYYAYFAGWVIKSFLPVFVLLAALISIGILARRNEILAMKASGLSLYRIAAPLLVFCLLLSAARIYYNEIIFPEGNKRRVEIKEFTIKKQSEKKRQTTHNIYRQVDKNFFYTIQAYNIAKMEGNDIKLYRSKENKLTELITAKKLRFTDQNWMLYDGAHRIFSDSAETYNVFDSMSAAYIKEMPSDFEVPLGKPEDMGYAELEHYINTMKRTGGPYIRELVDLRLKLSYPLTSFIVILICVPIASNPRRGGIAVSFAQGAGIALLYFVAFKVVQSFGYNEKLPPDIAAWLINGIFFLIGLFIMFRTRK
ncbi:MAG TPA: YjgP/YjgQ family permease [candidate division Zixibacteria bacterium]|nr:YjgP/YjgQ family permease [candidate division Zixibacteria bacterium]